MNQKYKINVYKIWYDDDPDNIYVGSTKGKLSSRMADHRCQAKKGSSSKLYNFIRSKGEQVFKYVLLESYLVECMDEQRKFEQYWVDQLKPRLNSRRAYCSKGDYKQWGLKYKRDNREVIRARSAEYRRKNLEKLRESDRNRRAKIYKKDKEKILSEMKNRYQENIRKCVCGSNYNYKETYKRNYH